MIKHKRNSNIELLRIICMISLVAHHFSIHGALYETNDSFMKYFYILFLPIGKICYDIYIVISCYFLANSEVKTERFIRTWLEVLFYNVIINICVFMSNRNISLDNIRILIGSFFPMNGNAHGYAITYLWFLILLPFLKLGQNKITKKNNIFIIIVLTTLQIGSWIIGTICGYNSEIRSEIFLFFLIYYICLYIHSEKIIIKNKKILWINLLCIIYILEYIIWYNSISKPNMLWNLLATFINNQSSPLNIIFALIIFLLINNIKCNYIKIINFIAQNTFAVLLIHDHNYFRQLLWNNIIPKQRLLNLTNPLFEILLFLTIVLFVFIICTIINTFYLYLENKILKSNTLKICIKKIDNFITN